MSKQNTLRVTKFKGLNKATNPHNIDDAELVTLENMFVTKNRGLESRKGYRRLGDVDIVQSYIVKGLFTTAWSKTDERLYYAGNGFLAKMDADGADTFISTIDPHGKTTQFDRYHDKVLFLNERSYLQWFNSDENLERVKYAEMQAATGSADVTITNAVNGGLTADTYYQYCISLILGDDYLDGESMGSKPAAGYTGSGTTGQLPYSQIGSSHPFWKTTATNLTLVGADVEFGGLLHGYNVGRIMLYRRKGIAGEGSSMGPEIMLTGDGEWRLVDIANIDLDSSAGTYSMSSSSYGFITDVTGTLVSDTATFLVDFTDTGLVPKSDGSDSTEPNGTLRNPWLETDVAEVKASHMGRLYNRIFLANVVGTGQVRDNKKVYFSYRGYRAATDNFEIPDVGWEHPMLIFPVTNYFYCDAEDVEDPITAITSFRDSMIIFTERCMFLWREGMGDPIKISNDIGCVSKRTVVEFEGKLIWLAHTGVFQYDGSKVKNMTVEKMQPYIDDLPRPYAHNCSACVYDRKYFIAGPFEGGTQADMMLVYDFDVEAWHVRKYHISTDEKCYIDLLYTDRDGAGEQLWAALKDPSGNVIIAEMEYEYLDQINPVQGESNLSIDCSIKTKYYSAQAPDMAKTYRNLLLDADNYYGDIDLEVYVDDLTTPKQSFTHQNNIDGFILGSATNGILGTDSLISLGDEIFRLSLERGLIGSRLQYGADLTASTSPLYIHLVGFEWTPKRKLKRRYGA